MRMRWSGCLINVILGTLLASCSPDDLSPNNRDEDQYDADQCCDEVTNFITDGFEAEVTASGIQFVVDLSSTTKFGWLRIPEFINYPWDATSAIVVGNGRIILGGSFDALDEKQFVETTILEVTATVGQTESFRANIIVCDLCYSGSYVHEMQGTLGFEGDQVILNVREGAGSVGPFEVRLNKQSKAMDSRGMECNFETSKCIIQFQDLPNPLE